MTQKSWSTSRQNGPPVSWNGQTKTFSIVLRGLKDVGDGVEAEWSPPLTYVVRIREASTNDWSFGFETPLTGCGFVDLKPDTDYEIEVRSKYPYGESGPVVAKARTNSDGSLGI